MPQKLSHSGQQIARAFAFSGAALLAGAVVFFLTQNVIPLTELPDIAGLVFHAGFFFIYFNLSMVLGRRFCSRTFELEHFPYLLGTGLVIPAILLSPATERLSTTSGTLIFFMVIISAAMAGAYMGILSGRRKREKLIRKALESGTGPAEK